MAWLVALLSVLGVIVCLALFVLWQMFWYSKKPRVKLPVEHPNGIPVLMQNGLPYPVGFSRTGNPVLRLDGDWLEINTPEAVDDAEAWLSEEGLWRKGRAA